MDLYAGPLQRNGIGKPEGRDMISDYGAIGYR